MAGFKASAGGKPLVWTRQPTDVYAFDIDVPAGTKSIDVIFDFLSPTRTSEGRVVVTPAMMNLLWEQVRLYPAGSFTRNIPVQLEVTLPEGWKIGRAHVCTPVTHAHLVCRLMLEKKKKHQARTISLPKSPD